MYFKRQLFDGLVSALDISGISFGGTIPNSQKIVV